MSISGSLATPLFKLSKIEDIGEEVNGVSGEI